MALYCKCTLLISMLITNVLCKPDPTATTPTITWRPAERSVDATGWNNKLGTALVNREWVIEIKIIGRGVNDYLKETFLADHEVKAAVKGSVLAGGDIKGETGWYTDTWASLVVVRNDGCTKNKYELFNDQTKITSTPMDPKECDTIKQKMVKLLIDHGCTMTSDSSEADSMFANGSPPQTPPLGSPSSPIVTYRDANDHVNGRDWYDMRNVYNSKEWCHQELILVGRGVNDLFTGKCSAKEDMHVVIVGKVLAIRDEGNDMGWFTEVWGTLNIVQQGKCFKRIYKDANGKTKITTSPLDDHECVKIKDKLAYYIKCYGDSSIGTSDPTKTKNCFWNGIANFFSFSFS